MQEKECYGSIQLLMSFTIVVWIAYGDIPSANATALNARRYNEVILPYTTLEGIN